MLTSLISTIFISVAICVILIAFTVLACEYCGGNPVVVIVAGVIIFTACTIVKGYLAYDDPLYIINSILD